MLCTRSSRGIILSSDSPWENTGKHVSRYDAQTRRAEAAAGCKFGVGRRWKYKKYEMDMDNEIRQLLEHDGF